MELGALVPTLGVCAGTHQVFQPLLLASTHVCSSSYVSAAFGSLDQPWKPGHLRSAYGAICCHRFKPRNMTDDIFLAQILGHKLLPGAAALSVGQSYKDFYVETAR